MNCEALAKELLKTPVAEVLIFNNKDWLTVHGVVPTGQHKFAVTLALTPPGGGEPKIVKPDEPKSNLDLANKEREREGLG
jgi:hypothetical protein